MKSAAGYGNRAQVLCVYRNVNSDLVEALADQTDRAGGDLYLWALDRPTEKLTQRTFGSGAGQRLALLNRLLAHAASAGPLVVVDDDVAFERGGLAELLQTARIGRLDLAQPAHASASLYTHRVTAVRGRAIARRTSFVEVGPLIVISPRLRHHITPFPEKYGMGWGLDVTWTDLPRQGFHLGVVDRVTIVHTGAVGAEYDTASQDALLLDELKQRDLDGMEALNRTLASWSSRGRFDPRSRVPLWLPEWATLKRRLRSFMGWAAGVGHVARGRDES